MRGSIDSRPEYSSRPPVRRWTEVNTQIIITYSTTGVNDVSSSPSFLPPPAKGSAVTSRFVSIIVPARESPGYRYILFCDAVRGHHAQQLLHGLQCGCCCCYRFLVCRHLQATGEEQQASIHILTIQCFTFAVLFLDSRMQIHSAWAWSTVLGRVLTLACMQDLRCNIPKIFCFSVRLQVDDVGCLLGTA